MKRERSARILATLGPAAPPCIALAKPARISTQPSAMAATRPRRTLPLITRGRGRDQPPIGDTDGPGAPSCASAASPRARSPWCPARVSPRPRPRPAMRAAPTCHPRSSPRSGRHQAARLTANCACGWTPSAPTSPFTTVLVGGRCPDRRGWNVPAWCCRSRPHRQGPRRPRLRLALGSGLVALSLRCSARGSARGARVSSATALDHVAKLEAGGDRRARADRRARRRRAWSRAATSAMSCRRSRCRCCSAASCAPHALPAVRWWWRRRCWSPIDLLARTHRAGASDVATAI